MSEKKIILKATGATQKQWGVLVLELRHPAAGVHQAAGAACPCRVNGRVDVERQLVAFLAPCRFHFHNGTVGHLDVDRVVFGMCLGFHRTGPYASAPEERGL